MSYDQNLTLDPSYLLGLFFFFFLLSFIFKPSLLPYFLETFTTRSKGLHTHKSQIYTSCFRKGLVDPSNTSVSNVTWFLFYQQKTFLNSISLRQNYGKKQLYILIFLVQSPSYLLFLNNCYNFFFHSKTFPRLYEKLYGLLAAGENEDN